MLYEILYIPKKMQQKRINEYFETKSKYPKHQMCHSSSSVEQCNEAFRWIRNMISDVMENALLH